MPAQNPQCFTAPLTLSATSSFLLPSHSSKSINSLTQRRPRHYLYHEKKHRNERHRPSTLPRMAASSAQLRRRISSVQSAEKIVSALRLVAAARIRASSNAALRSRPFAEELQTVLSLLIHQITTRRIDLISSAQSAPPITLSDMHGPILADPLVQTSLLNRMYLVLLYPSFSPPPSTMSATPVTIVTVITSERKFCGSYNRDVINRATQRVYSLKNLGVKVEMVLVGRIARAHFKKEEFENIPIRFEISGPSVKTADECASEISQGLLAEFIAGGVQRVEVVYTRFVSLLATVPSVRTLLPLSPTGLEDISDEVFQLTITSRNGRIVPTRGTASGRASHKDGHDKRSPPGSATSTFSNGTPMPSTTSSDSSRQEHQAFLKQSLYSISDEEAVMLLNSMLPMYFTSQVIRIVREAIASEQVSRLTAMTAATDNARDLISHLRTQYNKERQARITTEIIEVISSTLP